MTDAELQAILEYCEKATEGPWTSDWFSMAAVNDGSHKTWEPPRDIAHGDCAYCARNPGTLAASFTDKDGTWHTHRFQSNDWHSIDSAATHERIVGNYDYEEGGVASTPADADFIVHARADLPAVVQELIEARALLARTMQYHVEGNCDFCNETDRLIRDFLEANDEVNR